MKNILQTTFGVVVAFILFAGDSSAGAQPTLKKVKVSEAFQALHYLPLYIAIDKGFFKEEGLEISKVTTGSPSAALSAVISGSADFGVLGPEWTAVAASKGANVDVIANIANGAAAWIAVAPDVKGTNVNVLKGLKVVSGMMPTTSTSLFLKLLRDSGMQAADIEMLQVPIGSEVGPMLAGQAKVGVFYEPGLDQAVAGGMRPIVSFSKLYKDYLFAAISTRKDIDPDSARRFVRGLQKGFSYLRTNVQGAKAVALTEFPTLSPQVVESAVGRMIEDNVFSATVDISPASVTAAMQTQIGLGNLKEQPAYDKLVDRRFIDHALNVK